MLMARRPSIDDNDILHAAREVFMKHGVEGTTAEVARCAGISEGSIFNRFKSKDDLFRAAMATDLDGSPWMSTLEGRIGKGDIRTQLIEIGMQALEFFRGDLPFATMSWANRRLPPMIRGELPPARALRRMTEYFAAEMRAGRIRKTKPEIAARSFIGAIQSVAFLEILWNMTDVPAETFIRGHVDLLLTGLAPETRKATRR